MRSSVGVVAIVAALFGSSACVAKNAVAVDGVAPCGDPSCAVSSGGSSGNRDASVGGAGGSSVSSGGATSTGSGGAPASGSGGAPAGTGGSGADASAPVPPFTLVVDAPANHDALQGSVTVRGHAPGFSNVEVWDATHKQPPLAQTLPAADGAFTVTIDASVLAQGSTTWTVFAWDSPPGEPFTRTASVVLDLVLGTAAGDGGTGACASRRGAPGHVAPTCVKKALFGGAYMDLAQWAQKLGRASLDLQVQWDDVNGSVPTSGVDADWGWIAGHYSTNQWVVQAGWPGALALGMPMWVRGQSPFVCAAGTNDQHMTQAITSLRTMVGQRDVYIRLGWEFNADWYPTQASQGDATYQKAWKDCWVRWYDIIKAVSPQYMVVWNPNWANKGACQSGYTSVLNLWPGAEFVDAAGPDQYDANWCGKPAAYDEMDGEQPIGIGAWADWVIAKGVPFAVSEWGVDSGQWGSGDRPQFITDVYTALKKAHASDSGLAYQSYFDGGATYSCRFSLLDPACSLNPNSSTKYFELFKVWPPR